MDKRELRALKRSWIKLAKEYGPYEWCVHLTFRRNVSDDLALRYFYRFVRQINESLFGKRYREKRTGIYVVFARAHQKRGVTHFHALIGGGKYLWGLLPLYENIWSGYWSQHGRVEIQRYDQKMDDSIIKYIVGHLYEAGELDVIAPPRPHRRRIGVKFKGTTYELLKSTKGKLTP